MLLAAYLELQSEHFEEDADAVQEVIEDFHAVRSVPLEVFDGNMRRRYDIPR